MAFRFLDLGPLIDRELSLIAPDARRIDDVLNACRHELSRGDPVSATTREHVEALLRAAPGGRAPGDESVGKVPAYHFWMELLPQYEPPVRIAGMIGLRVGDTSDLQMYFGHLGYNVYPPARGNHLAERACRLLFPLARSHGLKTLWITCNPDNIASRRTCERLGGQLVDVVPIPERISLYKRGERFKCRYRLELMEP